MGNKFTDAIGKLVDVTVPLKQISPATAEIQKKLLEQERQKATVKR